MTPAGRSAAAVAILAAALSSIPAADALAGSHQWRFSEFYSSPDKTVQFIEMQEIAGSDNESALWLHWYETDSFNKDHLLKLGYNLPPFTANKKFLVGSYSYAALPGVPQPDYLVPDGIIEPSGDTIVWWFYQTLVIPPNTMPSDGVSSLVVVDPATPENGFVQAVNSPTNFAGETGTVQLPAAVPGIGPATTALLALVVSAVAVSVIRGLRGRVQPQRGA